MKRIAALFLFILPFTACEDVIEVELPPVDTKLVVREVVGKEAEGSAVAA